MGDKRGCGGNGLVIRCSHCNRVGDPFPGQIPAHHIVQFLESTRRQLPVERDRWNKYILQSEAVKLIIQVQNKRPALTFLHIPFLQGKGQVNSRRSRPWIIS